LKDASILHNRKTILGPNTKFERRIIFQNYLDNDLQINEKEREILLQCAAGEAENIGIIGCLLNDKTYLNTLRLAIGAKNKSNVKLASLSKTYLENFSIEAADNYYSIEKYFSDFTKVEIDLESVYNLIYY
jgi:histidyl-tRNA synthetase